VLLLYCMTDGNASAAADTPATGVGGAALQNLSESLIACWYSETTALPGNAREDVLAYHAVITAFFARGPVAPFRFPTTLPDTAALSTWLAANAPAVARELARLAPMVQMEIHLHPTGAASPGAATGRAYLESRRDAQRSLTERAELAKSAVADTAAEWHQRETREGLRCYALVPRGSESGFVARIDALGWGAAARVTGPWPPAEFLDASLTKLA
jgi:hypothetical protein